MLSDRLRPDVECAPWVIEEVKKLEAEIKRLNEKISEIEWKLSYANESLQSERDSHNTWK